VTSRQTKLIRWAASRALIGALASAAPFHSVLAHDLPVLVPAKTAQGIVDGEFLGDVIAYRGIPYAVPPLGELRFRPPLPPVPWTGVRSGLDMGPACPQLIDDDPTENSEAVMSEDCLTLNVWTPKPDAAKRPVLFWIHGGGFTVGAARNTWYDGRYLAARGDAVVVSINYRLGAWGFLDLHSFGARYSESANVGLLDQIAALKWVKQNIAAFGGDPENVTIFGESAGASSVGDLLSIPAAKNLFAKAILESGLPGGRTGNMSIRHAHLTQTFLKLAGAKTIDELSRKSMRELLDAQERLFSSTTDIGTFGPSIDGQVLKEKPFAVVTEGRGNRVPILIGTTREEMRYFSTAEDNGIERKPRALLLKQLEPIVGSRAEEVLNEYQRLYPTWGDTVVQIASDAIMRFPTVQLADAVSAFQPVYVYLFTYQSNSTYKSFGSAHAMDLPFVFGTVNLPEAIVFTGRDPRRLDLADRVMDSWVAFARSGDPTPRGGPEWPRYNASQRPTMDLGPEPKVVNDPLSAQRNFWGESVPTIEQGWQLLQVNQ
jgi:para-nitrobenzyl esterase